MAEPAVTAGQRLKSWLPAMVWAAVLFGLSSVPGSQIPPLVGISFADKIAHLCVYGVLGALCFRAWHLTAKVGPRGAVVLSVLVTLGYGISDEFHQMFVPQRSPEGLDVLADVLGGTLGAVGCFLMGRWTRHGRNP